MNSSTIKTLVSGVVAAQLAVIASADEMDPSVGWEKTLWYGAREVRVVAYTNTAETYQLQLPANVTWIDCLVVGGGGGGGGGWGGGGGAGGMVYRLDQPVSGTLSIKVGAGGAGASSGQASNSANGGNSTLVGDGLSITAYGGGCGARYRIAGGNGGSGGGAGGTGGSDVVDVDGGTGVSGQGHAGGKMRIASTSDGKNQCGAGGGGAGAPGQDAGGFSAADTGCGGDGLLCDITGEDIWYAGGGGGGTTDDNVRTGGKGGGGGGGISSRHGGLPGVDGLGGGGGGGFTSLPADCSGGKGGDGIVIVAYNVAGDSGKARNYWTSRASISKSEWWEGEKMGHITPPVAKLGTDTMVATISKDGGTPKAWGGGNPRIAGTYVITWTIPETEEREGLTTSLAFRINVFDTDLDPTVGWSKTVRSNHKNWVVMAYTNTTDTYDLTLPAYITMLDYLVVGGGGGGGGGWGGGGGAGGMVYRLDQPVSGTLSIKVGAGGAGSATGQSSGSSGDNSTLVGEGLSVTALGGGYGSSLRSAGGNGGSGGGAGGTGGSAVADVDGGTGVSGQGNAGGKMRSTSTSDGKYQCGSGGGGAGAPGQDAGGYSAADTGCGGDGLPCDITGEEIWYAGGGGGGTTDTNVRTGGAGGGGDGGISSRHGGLPGVNGLGGGGGGGFTSIGSDCSGGKGGDGIVIIRFAKPEASGFVIFVR